MQLVKLHKWAGARDLVEAMPCSVRDEVLENIEVAINFLVDIQTALERPESS